MTQPPLPTGDKPELIGTSHWLRYASVISSSDVRLCWMTVEEADGKAGEDVEGWFPKVNPYKVGLLLKNAVIDIAEPETLDVALNSKSSPDPVVVTYFLFAKTLIQAKM